MSYVPARDQGPIPASAWVERFVPQAQGEQHALDVAAGSGRHTRLLLDRGWLVTAVDRDTSALTPALGGSDRVTVVAADLETTDGWPFAGRTFDAVIVTNYLHRPLFPRLIEALAPGGLMIYETFARGHEAIGRPRRPEFLLNEGELLEVCRRLTIVAYESGLVRNGQALVQRVCAARPERPPMLLDPT
jgi:SAM-dependent methyltransferase